MNKFVLLLIFLTSCSIQPFKLKDYSFIPAYPFRLDKKLTKQKIVNNESYALLIGGNTEDRHRNTISLSYQVLIEQGYNKNNIFILDSEGGNPAIFPITDQFSKESLLMMINWLSLNITKENSLLIYLTGHGQRIDNESYYLINKSEMISKKELLFLISKIEPKIGIIIADFCYFGPHSEKDLSEFITITATNDYKTSYGDSFGRMFWNSFRNREYRISIMDAFNYVHNTDPASIKKYNLPSIRYSEKNPSDYDIMGINLFKNPDTLGE